MSAPTHPFPDDDSSSSASSSPLVEFHLQNANAALHQLYIAAAEETRPLSQRAKNRVRELADLTTAISKSVTDSGV